MMTNLRTFNWRRDH